MSRSRMMVAALAMGAIAASYGGCGVSLPPIRVNSDGTRKYLVSIIDDVGSVEVQIEEVCREEFHSWEVWHGQEPMGICVAALKAFGVSEAEIQEAMR